MKHTLFMRVELDVNGRVTRDDIKEAALKVNIGDIETGLMDENGTIEMLETNYEDTNGLMGDLVDIIKRRGV